MSQQSESSTSAIAKTVVQRRGDDSLFNDLPATHPMWKIVSKSLVSYFAPPLLSDMATPATLLLHTAQACVDNDRSTDDYEEKVQQAKDVIMSRCSSQQEQVVISFDEIDGAAWAQSWVHGPASHDHSIAFRHELYQAYLIKSEKDLYRRENDDRLREQQGSRTLPPILPLPHIKDALILTTRVLLAHEFSHIFGGLVTDVHPTPRKTMAKGYVVKGDRASKNQGERGSRLEELHFGGFLGVYLRKGQTFDWSRCCGLYLSVWNDEKKKAERWTISPDKYNIALREFDYLTPDTFRRFLRSPTSPEDKSIASFVAAGDILAQPTSSIASSTVSSTNVDPSSFFENEIDAVDLSCVS